MPGMEAGESHTTGQQSTDIKDKVLIFDAEPDFRSQMKSVLEGSIDQVHVLESEFWDDAWSKIFNGGLAVAVVPFNAPEFNALDLIHRIHLQRITTHVVITSGSVRAQDVVVCLRAGARDFLERPFPPEQLAASIGEILEKMRKERIEIYEEAAAGATELIGNSPPMESIRDLMDRVAPTNSTVLITGESGTGKEVVARSIHRRSKKNSKPLVVVDCGAIPGGLVESELFGHVSGAFTGASGDKPGLLEQANGGTVFLDEIGEFPLELQVKLLRVLQDGEMRRVGSDKTTRLELRVLAASNRELEKEVEVGRFRQDLFFRLNVVNINVPPLRERTDDIELFVNHFLAKYKREYNHSIKGITRGSMAMLKNYNWPGNVRELEHTMLQLMALHNKKTIIEERDLPMFLERRGKERQRRYLQDALDLKLSLDDYAREFVRMFEKEYSEKQMAQTLGVTTKTLWQKRKKWGMPRKKEQ